MIFTQEDFHTHAQRLTIIINDEMGLPPLSDFRQLSNIKKKKFNTLLNQYIQRCDSVETMIKQFNEICHEKVFDEMKCEEHFIKELHSDSILMMTPEQEEWDKEGRPLEPLKDDGMRLRDIDGKVEIYKVEC